MEEISFGENLCLLKKIHPRNTITIAIYTNLKRHQICEDYQWLYTNATCRCKQQQIPTNLKGLLPKYFLKYNNTNGKYILRHVLLSFLPFHTNNPNILDMIFYWWTKQLCIFKNQKMLEISIFKTYWEFDQYHYFTVIYVLDSSGE
jgi:hypothetical protein